MSITKEKKVCCRCGGKLSGIETVNNSGDPAIWSGCENCQVFTDGVPKVVWDIAQNYIKQRGFNPVGNDSYHTSLLCEIVKYSISQK